MRPAHETVLTYVNSAIGTCTEAMSASTSRYQDTAAMDFINLVQAQTVKAALVGTPQEGVPGALDRGTVQQGRRHPRRRGHGARRRGAVHLRQHAVRHPVHRLAGQGLPREVGRLLQAGRTGPFAAAEVTNAVTPTAPTGTPDYNYDIMGGLDARLTYDIDIAKDPGSRIANLQYDGADVGPGDPFVIAINNYRQSGGGGFPHVTTAPVVYNRTVEIRQPLIDWVTANQVIDPPNVRHRRLEADQRGAPITITP